MTASNRKIVQNIIFCVIKLKEIIMVMPQDDGWVDDHSIFIFEWIFPLTPHMHTHNEKLLMNYWFKSNLFFCLLPDMKAWGILTNHRNINFLFHNDLIMMMAGSAQCGTLKSWWLCAFDGREVDARPEFWSLFRRDGLVWRKPSEPNHLHRNQTSHGSHQQHADGLHLHHR